MAKKKHLHANGTAQAQVLPVAPPVKEAAPAPAPSQEEQETKPDQSGSPAPAVSTAAESAPPALPTLAVQAPQDEAEQSEDEPTPSPCSSPLPPMARKFSARTQFAFLSDQQIGEHWFFRLLSWFFYPWLAWFYNWRLVGVENMPKDEGALFIGMHSTHNFDIYLALVGTYLATGKVSRSLIHRMVMMFCPFFRYMGSVPGYRDTAIALLQSGFWVAVIPGGEQEAMVGHENAYKLRWPKKRTGFARVAQQANVKIYPTFTQNVEEMRWNPIFWLWNKTGLSKVYDWLEEAQIPVLTWCVHEIAIRLWFFFAMFSIPVPVRATTYIGKPVETQGVSLEELVARSHDALQALADSKQPGGLNYRQAIAQRFAPDPNSQTEQERAQGIGMPGLREFWQRMSKNKQA